MALLNGIYVFVEQEDVTKDMEVSSHSVETGISTTDTIKRKPTVVSISGVIVDVPVGKKSIVSETSGLRIGFEEVFMKASHVLSTLENFKNTGTLITYSGRNLLYNMQIVSFSTGHHNKVWGGAEFEMELQECRIVRNAYVAPKETTVKDGGQQQVDKGESKEVWYTVKKGDCVAALVAEPKAPYKHLHREGAKSGYWGACNWVMDKNPDAFSRKGDFRTLQIGKKLLLGEEVS